MSYHIHDGFQTQMTLTDLCMPVLVRPAGIHAVVDMQRLQPVKADDIVEFIQHAVKIVHYVISGIADMTCIQTHTHLFIQLNAVDDGSQFLEPAADLTALAGHGLQQDHSALLRRYDPVQQIHDELRTFFDALSHMTSRMEIVIVSGDVLHPAHVV